jgi:hypothetical protein
LAKGQFFYVLRDENLKIEEGDFVSIRKAEGGQSEEKGSEFEEKESELSINTSLRDRATIGS